MTRFQTLALVTCLAVFGAAAAAPDDPKAQMDLSVRPGDDFYAFANGGWLKATALPPGKPAYGTTDMLRALNAGRVADLVHDIATPAAARSTLEQQVGDFYASLTDLTQTDVAPLKAELAQIRAIHDRAALAAYLGRTTRLGDGGGAPAESIFALWVHQEFSQPSRNLPHLQQGGLGLSGRDDYLDQTADKIDLRAKYQALVASVLHHLGTPGADALAAQIVTLETSIARAHAPQADTDDVFKDDNLWLRAAFAAKAPGMDWNAYLTAAGLSAQPDFVVWQPSAVTGISRLVASEPLEVWKAYLAFHLVRHYAPELPKAYRDLFDAADALAITQDKLGEAVGRLYVARYFPPRAKQAANAMVDNIRAAYRVHLANLTWMSPETKAKALAKLDALNVGLGYPDTWTDYAGLKIRRDDALGNIRRVEAFTYRRALARLRAPVDPGEWFIAPQSVGAIINFFPNSLQFSAGLLQPPYFDDQGDAAANYGSAGAGIAHEISHSFDDLGNIYGAHGELGQWWTADDTQHFAAAGAPLAAQFGTYCPQPDLCVHGGQVLRESAADLGGLMIAYEAYHLSLHGAPDVTKDGFTGDQRFFIAYAQRWRKVLSEDALKRQIATDSHLPPAYRSDMVRYVDAWYAAFDIAPGDKLYLKPEERLHVW